MSTTTTRLNLACLHPSNNVGSVVEDYLAALARGLEVRRVETLLAALAQNLFGHAWKERANLRRSDHNLPPGYARLHAVLERAAAGESFDQELAIPLTPRKPDSAFHDWLVAQGDRPGMLGRMARDYAESVSLSDHRTVDSPDDLLELMKTLYSHADFDRAAAQLAEEYRALASTP